ncbi:MAG: DUF4271 domain-containing protein [Bacteroidales bacterium]|jgi:hypothetical protein|nr:DUF4271 domain-containing protein [Bacteroidales bacterium]
MSVGQGDTISVAADTLKLPSGQSEFSIGRIIPVISDTVSPIREEEVVSVSGDDYLSGFGRVNGNPRPQEIINGDMGFILLSLSLLIITLLTVFGRKSTITGLASISFRRKEEAAPPGTSEVFSWPPLLRNLFTIINISLFAAVSLLSTGVAGRNFPGGSVGLTAVLAGSFLAALLARHLTSIILAGITGLKNPFREYMNVIYNSWFACSTILFILSGITLFAQVDNTLPFIITGLVVTSIFLLIRVLRLLSIFNERHIPIFYFLLYLCALEVLPVLVILRILGII